MRIVVLGGYGVFGSRLAELLLRDGHEVWLAGRDIAKARALADRIGGTPLAIDRRADLQTLFAVSPNAVVDAAGPFQSYGTDPYRVPRLCLENGVDYLDLSDDADFTAGIVALDDAARGNRQRVISGVSSVPGLSSTIVNALSRNLDEILLIDTAILPGNRAPRGPSVIAGIVGQAGTSTTVWRGGSWRHMRGWSDRRRIRLGSGLVRTAYFVDVPDIRLFPGHFQAMSVIFRAGMELGLLNQGVRAIATLRRVVPFAMTPARARLLKAIADALLPFGTDQGGMRVLVVGRRGARVVQRRWTLIAAAGDGPYIPGIAARALLRKLDAIPPGARPALAEATLEEVTAAMADLSVSSETDEEPRPTLFQNALGDRWAALPPAVQDLHSVQDMESFSGTAAVTRGSSLIARFAGWFFSFPPASEAVSVTITKTRTDSGEIWERDFGGRVFRSYLTPAPAPHRYRERFWLLNYEQDLPVVDGCLHLPVRRGWFLGVPLPRFLLPGSESREFEQDGRFHFDVALSAPLNAGLIVRYRGTVTPDRSPPHRP